MGFRKGTGFTNINRVLQANRGSRLGGAVSGGITGQVQKVQSGIGSAQQKFDEEAQKNRLDTDEAKQKREEILGRFDVPKPADQQPAPQTGAGNMAPQSGQPEAPAQPAQAQPAAPANLSPVSDEEIKDFTKFRTGTYTGPSQLDQTGALTSQAQQAESLGQLARSQGGRQELLRQFVGGRDYGAGQRRLDETILGQDPSVNLGAAARQTRGAVNKVQEANQLAANRAEEYRQRAKIFGEETQGLIGEKKAPLSTGLDERVKQAQEAETQRQSNLKSIQDLLTGNVADYAGLDKMTRMALALDQAKGLGYLKDQDVNFLVGGGDQIGLLQRGANLGMDLNALIQERIKDNAAQNLSRTGVASEEDIARLNALDRLAGKQGTDLEFREGRGLFQEGNIGFDLGSLEDYITRAEGQKAASDKAYADKLAAEQARYLNQAKAYAAQGMEGAMGAAANQFGAMTNPGLALNPSQAGQAIGNQINAASQMAAGGAGAIAQGQNALLEGLTKLNVGGQSLANTPAGRQILKAIELKSKMENELLSKGQQVTGSVASGISNLGKGNIGSAIGDLSGFNLAKDLGSEVAKNLARETASAFKSIPGVSAVGSAAKSIKKKLKKMFSDEDLKENIEYSDKDVQSFMDRLKPASYDYKEEVRDLPIASKDRQIGIMAQDLEKSKLGKEAVEESSVGKIVDYKNLEPKMLASLAALNKRLKKLEGKE